jgi:MFS family permease
VGVRKLLLLVSLIMLVDTMFFAALTPLLPHYADTLGLSKTGAGVLTAAFGIGTLVGSLPAGLLAARIGVKPVVLLGLSLLALTSLAFGFGSSVWVLDTARFLQGFGGACTWTGSLAWLVSAAPPERRGELIGSALGAGIGGALLGPLLGGIAATVGTRPAFGGVAVLGAAIAAIVWAAPAVGRPTEVQTFAVLVSRLREPGLLSAMWLVTLPAILFGILSVLAPLRLHRLGWGAVAIGATFLVSAGLEAAASPVLGRLSDRRGPFPLVRAAALASAAVALLLPWPGAAWTLAVLVVAAAVAYGAFWVPALSLLSSGAEAAGLEQSLAFALMNLAWAAGQGGGSLVGGAVGESLGDLVPYAGGAALCLVTVAALGPLLPRARLAARPQG